MILQPPKRPCRLRQPTDLLVQARVDVASPAGWVLMATWILSVAPVLPVGMMFPPASSTATFGCVPNVTPPVDAVGDCVNAN